MEHFVEFQDVCKYYQTGSVKIAAADHMNFYVDKGDVDHLREIDDEFHDGIYAFSGRHVLMDTLRPLHRKTQRYRRASVAQRRQVSTDEHKAICEAICAGNEDEAERLMCEHIQNAKKSMIERFSQNGEYNR